MLEIHSPGGRDPEGEVVVLWSPSEKEKLKKRSDLFKKVAQEMEEAGVVPMLLPPIRSVKQHINMHSVHTTLRFHPRLN